MAKNKYFDTPFGITDHPHLNKPDTKFKPDNPEFKTGLDVEGPEAEALAARIDAEAQAAFDAFFEDGQGKDMTPAEKKKFTVYKPYERLEDAEGNPTGVIRFDFKQNAKLRLNDGTTKNVVIALYDAAGNELDPAKTIIRGGSVVRLRASLRAIPMKPLKMVGVRLDFAMVQVKELSKGGQKGFGAVDGYTADDDDDSAGGGFSPASDNDSADY
jgi:hypothetical protein